MFVSPATQEHDSPRVTQPLFLAEQAEERQVCTDLSFQIQVHTNGRTGMLACRCALEFHWESNIKMPLQYRLIDQNDLYGLIHHDDCRSSHAAML